MMLANNTSQASGGLFQSVLEDTEMGVLVVDAAVRAIYANTSARRLLGWSEGELPSWVSQRLEPMLEQLRAGGAQVLEKWAEGEMVLRVRARPLERMIGMAVLEISVAKSGSSREIADLLSRSLHLTITDSRLLVLLWQGLSNDEIASTLGVRVGTVKSRLFRLYQKLGVKRRAAAVLRAAEVLG
jgi:DNA-binding CsgD family transcriptional regulator